jgi:hypothetical protein
MRIGSEIWINNKRLDLYGDIPHPLNYQVADIREPAKRKASHSLTLIIPGTDANNKLFTQIFDIETGIQSTGTINFSPDFNPNLKAVCQVLQDTVEVFNGYAQLLNIITNDHDEIQYEIAVYSRLFNLYTNLGDKKLTDLDFSEFDHTYDKNAQQLSWQGDHTYGYVYPMIDYGLNDGHNWNVEDFFPAIYLKTYIDKIFDYAGFSYISDFLEGEFFNKLVIPMNTDEFILSQDEIDQRVVRASRETSNQEYTTALTKSGAVILFNDDSTAPNSDAGSNYDTGTGEYTSAAKGRYSAYAEVDVDLRHEPDVPAYQMAAIDIYVDIYKEKTNGATELLASRKAVITLTGSEVSSGDTSTPTLSGSNPIRVSVPRTGLFIGEKLYVKVDAALQTGGFTQNSFYGQPYGPNPAEVGGEPVVVVNTTNSFFEVGVVNDGHLEGDAVSLNNAVPKNVKMRDLLTSTINLFNLYTEDDPNTDNLVQIEPRDDYYASGTIQDWTTLQDFDKPVKQIPMGELDFKTFLYTYKPDRDYLNEKYTTHYGETYGQAEIEVNNDFIKKTRKVEVLFSPTPLWGTSSHDRVISQIIAKDENGTVSKRTANLRLLYNGGVKTGNAPYNYRASSGVISTSDYLYAGHLDDVAHPTVDLNYGVPREVYYQATKYTTNNLYNIYHRRYVEEITAPDSKVVRAWFYLTPREILALDFKDKYYFMGTYFRLLKVINYDPVVPGITECEFIRIKDTGSSFSEQKDVGGGVQPDVPLTDEPLGPTGGYVMPYGGGQRLGAAVVIDPTATDALVKGSSYVNIGPAANAITVLNSSGVTVPGGAQNVTVLNSSGVTDPQDDTLYMFGKPVQLQAIEQSFQKTVTSGDIRSLHSTEVEVIPAPGDGQTVDVISAVSRHIEGTGVTTWSGSLPYLGLKYATGGDAIGQFNLQWGQTRPYCKLIHDSNGVQQPNEAVNLYTGGTFTDGNGYYIIEVMYRITNL